MKLMPGESVYLSCQAPPHLSVSTFQLRRPGREAVIVELPGPEPNASFALTNLSLADSGLYTCGYTVMRGRETHSSPHSPAISLAIQELPSPEISLLSLPPFLFPGSDVHILCRFPVTSGQVRVCLQRERQDLLSVSVTGSHSATFTLHNVTATDQGNYSCRYQPGSHLSNSSGDLALNLSAEPGAALISLSPADSVYLRGEAVTITCRVPVSALGVTVNLDRLRDPHPSPDSRDGDLDNYWNTEDVNTDGDTDSETNGDGETYTDGEADGDTVGESETDGDTETDSETDGDTDGDTDTDSETDGDTDGDTDTDSNGETDGDSDIDGEADGDSDGVPRLGETLRWERDVQPAKSTRNGTVTFLITALNRTHHGNYSCRYHITVNQLPVISPSSRLVSVLVRDEVGAPSLSVLPPVREVLSGGSVRMDCRAPFRSAGSWTLTLYRDTGRVLEPVTADLSASFTLRNVSVGAQGRYWCQCEQQRGEQYLLSAPSLNLNITITELVSDEVRVDVMDGEGRCDGRLRLLYNGQWGDVCRAGWLPENGDVACRQLECGFTVPGDPGGKPSAEPSDAVWLQDLRCSGDEMSIWECPSIALGNQTCPQGQRTYITCTAQPEPPSLLLSRGSGQYLLGEWVQARCSPPTRYSGSRVFVFSVQAGTLTSLPLTPGSQPHTFLLPAERDLNLTCLYQLQPPAWLQPPTNSSLSNIAVLTVTEVLSVPVLDVGVSDRRSDWLWGEDVVLICHSPVTGSRPVFELWKDGQKVAESSRQTFTIRSVTVAQAGDYSCSYRVQTVTATHTSNHSQSLRVTVTDRPSQPMLEITVFQEELESEEVMLVACQVPFEILHHRDRFSFYLHQRESPAKPRMWAARLPLPIHTGTAASLGLALGHQYGCSYQLHRHDRDYTSTLSDWVTLSMPELPASPNLAVTGSDGYFVGQSVTLSCSVPGNIGARWFYLFRDGVTEAVASAEATPGLASAHFILQPLHSSHSGNYTCRYLSRRYQIEYNSTRSQTVSIRIFERLPKPGLLLLSGEGMVLLSGESVSLGCSPPGRWSSAQCQLLRDGAVMPGAAGSRDSLCSFLLPNVSSSDTGSYTCSYRAAPAAKGAQIESTTSDSLYLTVTDPLAKPEISLLDTETDSVTVRCSVSDPHPSGGGRVYLFSVGDGPRTLLADDQLVGNVADFPLTNLSALPSLVCVWEMEIGGRRLQSQESDSLVVRKPEPEVSFQRTIFLWSFATLVILVLIVVAALGCKKWCHLRPVQVSLDLQNHPLINLGDRARQFDDREPLL